MRCLSTGVLKKYFKKIENKKIQKNGQYSNVLVFVVQELSLRAFMMDDFTWYS